MSELSPFIRYIALIEIFSNKDFTKAYDCRFIYVIEGSCILFTEQGNYTLKQDSLVYYPCGVTYCPSQINSEKGKYISVNFDFTNEYSHLNKCICPVAVNEFKPEKLMPTYLNVNHSAFSSIFVIDSVPYIKEDLLRLISLHNKNNQYAQKACSALMETLLYNILYRLDKTEKTSVMVTKIKEYININFFNCIDNKKIADDLAYHPHYINSVFKNHTGTTIHKYLMEYRVKKSCELLISTDMSIEDIAFACGFTNQTHYSTYFKKVNSISPLNYRKKYTIM